jgi:phosphonate transport system permease protein
MVRTSLLFLLAALLCLPWADLQISTLDPWLELSRLGWGLLTPLPPSTPTLLDALANTLAFALQGVALGAVAGFWLALFYRWQWVRTLAAFIRSIHELFWALLFVQLVGLSSVAGVLAIAIPYAGTFAKIYGELFEEVDPAALEALPAGTSRLSAFFFTVLPPAWPHLLTYTRYRLECGIRSSAVLGFIGLPTVGFHLETALKQGMYSEAAALFYALVLVIVTLHLWMRRQLLPLYLLLALWWLPPAAQVNPTLVWQFFTVDIVPAPLRAGWDGAALWLWLQALWLKQIGPGLANTVVLGLIALVATSGVTLLTFPLVSRLFGNIFTRSTGHVFLVLMRSAPEYLLAFVGLLLWGPSMLPAIVALGLHNGAIIAHLVGHYSNELNLREDAVTGFNRYFYEVLPRVYRTFLAFTLYRFEILLRESAILGILGIPTLGFFIDSAFSEFRFDRALLLLLVTALLNMAVDMIARHLRRRLQLSTHPEDL